MDVVCLPGMEWDHGVWTNRQHVMSRLPRVAPEARVLYVSPPRFALTGRLVGRRRLAPAAPTGERLHVVQPLLPVPARLATRIAPRLVDAWTLRSARRAMRRLGFRRPLLWAYTPRAARFVGRLDERLVVYDVVDDYPSLPGAHGLAALDRELTRRADLVFTASRVLHEERRGSSRRCVLVGNAADVDLFRAARGETPAPSALAGLDGPLLGFHGSLSAHKLDLDLVRELALRRPEWTLVLVGPETDGKTRTALGALPNVRLLGPVPHAELPAFLARFDVCLVPYRLTPYTVRLNALKLYECLAAGRPVVATDLPCARELEPHVLVAHGVEAFDRAVAEVLAGHRPPELPDVQAYGWEAKTLRMWQEATALAGGERYGG